MAPPLVIKIVKYGGVWGGGRRCGCAKILQKIMAQPLSVKKIVSIVESGKGGHWGGASKILQKIMAAPSLSLR